MNVTLEVIPRPQTVSFTVLAEPKKDILRETKEVTIRGGFITKTRINTVMHIGESCTGVNLSIDGFKTDRVEEFSYFTGHRSYPEYFKKSKKQNVDSYKEYVKEVVKKAIKEYLHVSLDTIHIKLILPDFN